MVRASVFIFFDTVFDTSGHMPQNINSAYRIHQILSVAMQQDPKAPTGTAWARAFGFDDTEQEITGEPSSRDTDVARALALLHDEIVDARDQMRETEYGADLYEDAFHGILRGTSPSSLRTGWSDFRQHLTKERLIAIKFCSEILPDEERLVAEKDFDDIKSELCNLRSATNERDLPPELKKFILDLISIIERAIRDYPVSGAKAFKSAFIETISKYVDNEDLVRKHKDASEVSRIRQIWNRFTEVTQQAETLYRFLDTVGNLSNMLGLPPGK